MSGIPHDHYEPKSAGEKWLHKRLPIVGLLYDTLMIPTPKNLNWMVDLGHRAGVLPGACRSSPASSWRCITRRMSTWRSPRRTHHARRQRRPYAALSAHERRSLFFFAVYIHIFRGLYYGSYKAPREITWIVGMLIFLLMMATGFMGYVLPWGQMSFWGATVITGLFGAIPFVGEPIQTWLLGGPAVDNATLNRFFSLHYLLPFVIAGLVVVHIWAFHTTGNNNPTGVSAPGSKAEAEKDTLPFWPYFVIKDLFALA